MSIAFYDRPAATATFRRYRRTWGRAEAWTLTLLHCARDPDVRFAAALALVVYGIPANGVPRSLEVKRAA